MTDPRPPSPLDPDESDGNLVIDLESESGGSPQKRPAPPTGGRSRKRSRHSSVIPESAQPSTSVLPADGLGEESPAVLQDGIASEKVETSDAGTNIRSISTVTEGGLFGVCEPGTQVSLEGCIFHEDPEGFLVVNVTWRGKSYVGTLVDSSRQEWGPPRPEEFNGSDSERKGPKGRGGKRTGREMLGGVGGGGRGNWGVGTRQGTPIPRLKSRPSFSASPQISVDEEDGGDGDAENSKIGPAEPLSPVLTECPCKGCNKKFVSEVALKYHQSAKHKAESDLDDSTFPQMEPLEPTPAEADLTPVENESLQKLFATIKPSSDENREAPDLEPKEEDNRPSSRSPAYSDISDEGAPILASQSEEREGEKTQKTPVSSKTKVHPDQESNPVPSTSNSAETPAKQPQATERPLSNGTPKRSGDSGSGKSSKNREAKVRPQPSHGMSPQSMAFMRPSIMNVSHNLTDGSPLHTGMSGKDKNQMNNRVVPGIPTSIPHPNPFHFQLGPPNPYTPSSQPLPFDVVPPFVSSPTPNFNFSPISRPSLHSHSSPLLQRK